jgi:hypothetical protein
VTRSRNRRTSNAREGAELMEQVRQKAKANGGKLTSPEDRAAIAAGLAAPPLLPGQDVRVATIGYPDSAAESELVRIRCASPCGRRLGWVSRWDRGHLVVEATGGVAVVDAPAEGRVPVACPSCGTAAIHAETLRDQALNAERAGAVRTIRVRPAHTR